MITMGLLQMTLRRPQRSSTGAVLPSLRSSYAPRDAILTVITVYVRGAGFYATSTANQPGTFEELRWMTATSTTGMSRQMPPEASTAPDHPVNRVRKDSLVTIRRITRPPG